MANRIVSKRTHDVEDISDLSNVNPIENLNDEEFDVTWGGKRCRYMYNYTLQSPVLFNDSDDTESVLSIQSKSTIEIITSNDNSSESCSTDCDCENSSRSSFHTEYELVTSSSPYHINSSNSSDSSSSFDYEVKKIDIICDRPPLPDSENCGYFPDDTDIEVSVPKICGGLPPPACFKTCLQCLKENPNPYFQYCHTCFKNRMDFFGSKPKSKKLKPANVSCYKSEESLLKDSHDFSISNSQQSNEIAISSLFLSKNKNFRNGENSTAEMIENICNICFILPKNGVFNHGKISHIAYCCYNCAKQLWKKNNKCPLCNVKIKFVTKMIVV